MKIENINKKLKNNTFKLCVGVILGVSIITLPPLINNYDKYQVENTGEKSVSEMTLEEKLETRGGIEISFNNKEYLQGKRDCISFFDKEGNGYGIVYSDHTTYTITFEPGTYEFYSEQLNQYGEFEITKSGEIKQLEINYQNNTYELHNTKNYSK